MLNPRRIHIVDGDPLDLGSASLFPLTLATTLFPSRYGVGSVLQISTSLPCILVASPTRQHEAGLSWSAVAAIHGLGLLGDLPDWSSRPPLDLDWSEMAWCFVLFTPNTFL